QHASSLSTARARPAFCRRFWPTVTAFAVDQSLHPTHIRGPADRSIRRRHDPARLHLHRRCDSRHDGCVELRRVTFRHLQSWRERDHSAQGFDLCDREGAWEKSKGQSFARATGRHAADLRGHFEGKKITRLQSGNAIHRWIAAIRRVVFADETSTIVGSTIAMPATPESLPFDQRACFVAGPANPGTKLLLAPLDNHPELLVLPEETAYFPTVLTKYAPSGRSAQLDYLTTQSLSNVLFGGPCKWGKRSYASFPREKFL